MKTTATGKTYLEQFVGEFKKWANTHDIPYMDLGSADMQDVVLLKNVWYGPQPVFVEATGTHTYLLHNHRLGYGTFKLVTRNNGRDLLAVSASEVTPTLLKMINMLGMYNGVRVRSIVQAKGVSNQFLFVFDY